ncbi:TRI47 protein, partial [Polypterus senegalus]
MAGVNISASDDLVTCPVCLDPLRDPVSLPCGHSYCMKCISDFWDQNRECRCPQCRQPFSPRPELRRNTVLAEVVQKLKKAELSTSEMSSLPPGHFESQVVECDACTGTKLSACKSCLTCLASFCETHIQSHYEIPAWRNHKLVNPIGSMQDKICSKHHKALDIFCRTDDMCICYLCVATGHKSHETVEPQYERTLKETLLGETLIQIREKIHVRERKLADTKQCVDKIKVSADREVQMNNQSLAHFISTLEQKCATMTQQVREQEKKETEMSKELMERLKKEIETLKRRDGELIELAMTDDHIYFLQKFSSLCSIPGDDNSLAITVTAEFSTDLLRKELSHLKDEQEKCKEWKLVKFAPTVAEAPVYILLPSPPQSREEFLHYSCQLKLDSKSAHKHLHLSEENTLVTWSGKNPSFVDHPGKFDYYEQVLCKEGLTGIRSYWEVVWNRGAVIGVTYKGISRKGNGTECGLGYNDKSWVLMCSDYGFSVWHNNKESKIISPCCPKIGIYLDREAGLLSFYAISEKMTLLYSFQTTFTEPLYPAFRLCYSYIYSNFYLKICKLR